MQADYRVTEIYTEEATGDVIAKCYDVLYGEYFEKFLGQGDDFDGKENASNLLQDSNYEISDEIRADIEDIFGVAEFNDDQDYDSYQFYDFGDEDIDDDYGDEDFDDEEDFAVPTSNLKRESLNLREALNQIDLNTYNKYDLLNLYESCNLSENEKRALANIVYDQNDPSVIYDTLNNRFVGNKKIEMPERVKDGVIHEDSEDNWSHFTFKSGANPYISKTEKDKSRMLKKYGDKVRQIKDGYYEVNDDDNIDLFGGLDEAVATREITNVHTHKGSFSGIVDAHMDEINAMIVSNARPGEFVAKLSEWVRDAELTKANAAYADNAIRRIMTMRNAEQIGRYLWDIRLKAEDPKLGSIDSKILGRNKWKRESQEKVYTKKNGDYLVKGDNGGYQAFSKDDVHLGHIDEEDPQEAQFKFDKNQFTESKSIKESIDDVKKIKQCIQSWVTGKDDASGQNSAYFAKWLAESETGLDWEKIAEVAYLMGYDVYKSSYGYFGDEDYLIVYPGCSPDIYASYLDDENQELWANEMKNDLVKVESFNGKSIKESRDSVDEFEFDDEFNAYYDGYTEEDKDENSAYNKLKNNVDESLLQDLHRDHENVKKEYGQEVYDAMDEYIELGNDLGDILYRESEWNKFVNWAKKEKGIEVKLNVDESKSIKEDYTFSSDKDDLCREANIAYRDNDKEFFQALSDEELAMLWSTCLLTPYSTFGAAYDDEVYDAIADRANSEDIFKRAKALINTNN